MNEEKEVDKPQVPLTPWPHSLSFAYKVFGDLLLCATIIGIVWLITHTIQVCYLTPAPSKAQIEAK